MTENSGYIVEHCRPNCPRNAKPWELLQKDLDSALSSLNLSETLTKKFKPLLYHQIAKISLAGCPNGCSQPLIKDFGVIGYVMPKITDLVCQGCGACVKACQEKALSLPKGEISINSTLCLACGDCVRVCPSGTLSPGERGWNLYLGGRVGRHPHFAEWVGKATGEAEVIEWVTKILNDYLKYCYPQERLTNFLERVVLMQNSEVRSQSSEV
ncbi:MAG: 4Fe-4S dicluster domain-containing protein [Desulfitobacteriaceae bacterium]